MTQNDRERAPISPALRSRIRSVPDARPAESPPPPADTSNPLITQALERFEHHRREMQRWAEFLKMCRELDNPPPAEEG